MVTSRYEYFEHLTFTDYGIVFKPSCSYSYNYLTMNFIYNIHWMSHHVHTFRHDCTIIPPYVSQFRSTSSSLGMDVGKCEIPHRHLLKLSIKLILGPWSCIYNLFIYFNELHDITQQTTYKAIIYIYSSWNKIGSNEDSLWSVLNNQWLRLNPHQYYNINPILAIFSLVLSYV